MLEILFSILIICLVVGAMAVGVIAGRKPIQGSCGGLGAIGIDGECEICGGDPSRCEEATAAPEKDAALGYELPPTSR